MPDYLRALIIILALSTTFFVFARQPVCSIIESRDFRRRRNLWFGLTLAAFLSHNFWLYTLIAIVLLIYAKRRETNLPALYFFILFALPMATMQIPGMGVINYFFDLSHARILALVILLPAFLVLIRQESTLSFGRTWPDKALAAFLLLNAMIFLRDTTFTDALRGNFYLFIDVFLPYFVISRSLKNLQDFRAALLSLVLAIMVVALVAVFEFFKLWLLYLPLLASLELNGMLAYLGREGMLRAVSAAGHSIALGYLMVVGLGLYLFMQRSIRHKLIRRLGMALLATGLIVTLSRGPWVGAAVLMLVFIVTGRNPIRRLMSLALVTMLALPLAAVLPGGEKVINMLPFIGSTEKETIDYRADLITNSMIVIKRNPLFGSATFLETPEMESMRQGQGIIDVVNTYLSVTLGSGFTGLGLFVGFFALTLLGIYRSLRSISDRTSEEHLLGRALLSTILAIMVTIFTVSSITIIPIVYWTVAGVGVAYAQMVRRQATSVVFNGVVA